MYKRFAVALFMVLSLLVSPFMAPSAKATVVNTLIKIEASPTVYWYAADGKRYVFPNARTFYSWFTADDLARVLVISPQELGSITIGGNVTYRPGARLVKVTTDPRVYAVGRYGTLRWITSEALAQQLYGQNWAQQVDDVPDEYFTNYRVGDAIYTSSQYNVQFELGQARSPSENISNQVVGNPYTPSNQDLNGQLTLSLSNSNPSVGDTITFTARLNNSTNNPSDITLSLFSITGETLRTCVGTLSCSHDWYMNANMTGFGRTYYARATHRNGRTVDSGGITLQVRGTPSYNNAGGFPTISLSNNHPALGETVTLTAATNNLDPRLGTLNIVGPNGSIIQTCLIGSSNCSYSFVMDATIATNMTNGSQGVYTYTARFLPTSGVGSNSTAAYVYAPSISNVTIPATVNTLSFDRSSVRPGESFTVTSRLTPDSSGAPYYTIRIYDQWNVLQHTCERVRTCVLQQTLSQTTDASRTYYASAIADNGQSIGSGNATIQVTQSAQYTNGSLGYSQPGLALSPTPGYITASPLTVYTGTTLTISSDLQQPVPSNLTGITIKLYQLDGILLKTCSGVSTCSVSKVLTNDGVNDVTLRFKARAEDANGSYYETAPASVIVRNTSPSSNGLTTGTLSAGIDHSSIASSQPFTLTAKLTNATIPTQNLKISWHQSSNDALMSYCEGTNPCDITTSYPAPGGQPQTLSFYAKATDRTGAYSGSVQSSPVTITITP
jgi:hypothetical protein